MLSIIIVSFNTKDLLRGCLSSIFEANLMVDFEVIVVDNDSRDGSVEMCKIEFPDVIILENKKNNMFAKANNQGMAVAAGDALLLLNSDTVIQAGVLETLYAFISENSQVAAVGPRLINADGSLQSQGYPLSPMFWTIVRSFSLDRILPKFLRNLLFPWTNSARSTSMRTGWISGACILISRRAVDKLGGLCEDLYFYGEEVEWCWRAKKNNWQVWCLPFIEILHYGGC
jgi:GT2 family glycosyltransferase